MQRQSLGLAGLPRRQLSAALRRETIAAASAVARLGLPLVPERIRFVACDAQCGPGVERVEFEVFSASGSWKVTERNAGSDSGEDVAHGR